MWDLEVLETYSYYGLKLFEKSTAKMLEKMWQNNDAKKG